MLFRSLARKQFKDKPSRQRWVYSELDRMYPPKGEKPPLAGCGDVEKPPVAGSPDFEPVSPPVAASDDGQIQGLGDLPPDWPDLPSNASLPSEVAWVQANRLRIVSEKASGATLVHLDRAMSPAPSWAALGWLEISIRSYAKFVDVAAKVSGSSDDGEAEVWRRERMAIEEMRGLLEQLMEDDV